MEKFNLIKRACNEQKVCEVLFKDERVPLYIHPVGICLTFNRGVVIVCAMEDKSESTEKMNPAICNLAIEDCNHIRIIEKNFQVLPHFIAQTKICDDWLFHI